MQKDPNIEIRIRRVGFDYDVVRIDKSKYYADPKAITVLFYSCDPKACREFYDKITRSFY